MATVNIVILTSLFYFGSCLGQVQPENDSCENAIDVTNLFGDLISSSTMLGDSGNNFSINLIRCGGQTFNANSHGVWFELMGTGARLRASTCSEETNFTNRITIFEGDVCDQRSCLYSGKDEDPNCSYTNSSFIEWESISKTIYYVLVHDRNVGESGTFGLRITDETESPENDSCENALELEEESVVQGTTIGATMSSGVKCDRCPEDGPQNPGVWYKIPPSDTKAEVIVATCGVESMFNVSVFYGNRCDELSCQEATPDLDATSCDGGFFAYRSTFVAEKEEEYHLYVHGAESSDGLNTGRFGVAFFRSEVGEDGDIPSIESKANTYLIHPILMMAILGLGNLLRL